MLPCVYVTGITKTKLVIPAISPPSLPHQGSWCFPIVPCLLPGCTLSPFPYCCCPRAHAPSFSFPLLTNTSDRFPPPLLPRAFSSVPCSSPQCCLHPRVARSPHHRQQLELNHNAFVLIGFLSSLNKLPALSLGFPGPGKMQLHPTRAFHSRILTGWSSVLSKRPSCALAMPAGPLAFSQVWSPAGTISWGPPPRQSSRAASPRPTQHLTPPVPGHCTVQLPHSPFWFDVISL